MSTAETTLKRLLDRAETIYSDLEFSAVKRWKEAHPGHKALGYLPVYAPTEIVHAAGMLPVAVRGGGPDLEIIRGDAYFQSYICHLPRSVVDLGVSGKLDVLDGMLFPSTCDVVRNLSGMWKMLFPDRYVRYLDLPHSLAPELGGKFLANEWAVLKADLERLSGAPLKDDALHASIRVYNRHRALLQKLYDARAADPARVPTSEAYLVVRAGDVMPVEDHIAFVGEYLEATAAMTRPEMDLSRVVVTGAFCEQRPLDLLRTLERSGCGIVDDDLALGTRWLTKPVREDGEPLEALALAYVTASVSNACRYEQDETKGKALIDNVRRVHADGVIFCAPSFCDPALLERPMLQAALDREKIPHTSFKYAENTGQFQVIREQAGTFSDTIKLWSNA